MNPNQPDRPAQLPKNCHGLEAGQPKHRGTSARILSVTSGRRTAQYYCSCLIGQSLSLELQNPKLKGKGKEETKHPPNPPLERRKGKEPSKGKGKLQPPRHAGKGAVCFPFLRMGILPPSRIRLTSWPPVAIPLKQIFSLQGWSRSGPSFPHVTWLGKRRCERTASEICNRKTASYSEGETTEQRKEKL